jgi:hypothetical protein
MLILTCSSVGIRTECLPGRIPITLDSVLPRYMGSGSWKYRDMIGYTSAGAGSSIVPARFNCPPEITLDRLRRPVWNGMAIDAASDTLYLTLGKPSPDLLGKVPTPTQWWHWISLARRRN